MRWRSVLVVAGLLLLLLPTMSAIAQDGGEGTQVYLPVIFKPLPAVTQIGPSGGTFPAVVVSPTDSAVLFVGTWGLGVKKSTDGGQSWEAANQGMGKRYIQSLAILPDGITVFAGTYGSGVYRSTDGGLSWAAINLADKSEDTTLLQTLIVYDIEIDPTNPQTIYISGRTPGDCTSSSCNLSGYAFKSSNGGDQWTKIWNSLTTSPVNGDYSYDIDVDPNNPTTVYIAAHRNGVIRSTNGGASWDSIQTTVKDLSARKLVINPGDSLNLYNSTYKNYNDSLPTIGVYKSTNGGTGWVESGTGLPNPAYGFALTLDPGAPNLLYLGTGTSGVYKSTNSAGSWSTWGLSSNFIWDLQFDSPSPALIYAATGGNGLQVTSTGAAGWQSADTGIFNTNVSSLVVLPGQTSTIYAAVVGGGVFRTSDQGETWEAVNSGLTDLNVNWLFNQTNKLYAVTNSSLFTLASGASSWTKISGPQVTASIALEESSPASVSESDAPFSERQLLPEEEQILLSTDGSDAALVDPLTATITKPITASAEISEGIYAGTSGAGIWLKTSTGWKGCGYNDTTDPRTIYALFYNPYDGKLYASINLKDNSNYLIIRRNICDNWDADSNSGQIPFTVRTINFAASPTRMFAATTNGIYSKPNGTTSWAHANGISGSVYDIAVDPANTSRLYAAASTGTYYSVDGGLNWYLTPKAELQSISFVSVEVDRTNSNIVYFGSKEGSTYRWDRSLN
jgi:photosystem II stability/assembly factor-like uncharacterized protein